MQPSFMSNMTLDEKQNGCDKKQNGYTGSKMGRKFEQKRKAKWVKKKKIWSRPTNEAWLIHFAVIHKCSSL